MRCWKPGRNSDLGSPGGRCPWPCDSGCSDCEGLGTEGCSVRRPLAGSRPAKSRLAARKHFFILVCCMWLSASCVGEARRFACFEKKPPFAHNSWKRTPCSPSKLSLTLQRPKCPSQSLQPPRPHSRCSAQVAAAPKPSPSQLSGPHSRGSLANRPSQSLQRLKALTVAGAP